MLEWFKVKIDLMNDTEFRILMSPHAVMTKLCTNMIQKKTIKPVILKRESCYKRFYFQLVHYFLILICYLHNVTAQLSEKKNVNFII